MISLSSIYNVYIYMYMHGIYDFMYNTCMLYVYYMSFEGYDMNVWVWADLLE